MTTKTLICSTAGFNKSIELTELEFEQLKDETLDKLRNLLNEKDFFESIGNSNSEWRFVSPNIDTKDAQTYNTRIIGKELEDTIGIERLLAKMPTKEIILTDINKTKNPDFMGFSADWFTGGDLRVQCSLNNRDEQTRNSNHGKFQPFMLTNVMSTSEKSSNVFYENVCICCKDSIVEFKLRCFGEMGFFYKSKLASGAELRYSGTRWADGIYDVFGETSFWSWGGKDESIVMKAIKDVSSIDPATKMSYMKVTFKAVNLKSWIENDTKRIHRPLRLKMSFALAAEGDGGAFVKTVQNNKSQVVIGGKDVTPATPTKGDQQHINYGNWWSHETDDWDTTSNHLDVYFFVFEDLNTAKKYFDKYNWCPLNEQAKILGVE